MSIFKNGIGDVVAYLPDVRVVDPSCVPYDHVKQQNATYDDLCGDIIRGCDIGIEKLQSMRATYEHRRVQAAMGLPPVFDVLK